MKIRLLPILFVAIVFGFQNISAQAEKQISSVRAEVAAINKNIAKWKRTKKDVEGIALEGTEATFYSAGAALKKTAAKMYGETFNAVAEIYYKENKPIFIYQKFNRYDRPFSMSPKIISVEETRIYYVGQQIVRILVGKKEIEPTDEKFEELKKDFDDFSGKLFSAFRE